MEFGDPVDDGGDAGDPFPLAPMQHAMWLGRNDDQQLGGVAAHLYVEFDGAGVDPNRLRDAAAKLVARHPMLRVEILPDGTQRIGDRGLPVTVYDLRELDAEAAEQRLEAIRHEKSHQLLDGDVLELSLSLRPDGRTRLHVDMDMNAADAVSYRKFMADLAVFYRGGELPELGYTYRQYRAALTAADSGTLRRGPAVVGRAASRAARIACAAAGPVGRTSRPPPQRPTLAHLRCRDTGRTLRGRAPPRAHARDGRRGVVFERAGAVVERLAVPAQPADVRS